MDKMVMHLNVLGPSMEYEVFRKVDTAEIVAIDRHRIRNLYLQIL